jgi:S1-C subfamily serine protease
MIAMRFLAHLPAALVVAIAASPAAAQIRIQRAPSFTPAPGLRALRSAIDAPRAVIGVSTSSGATSRDTVGVLVGSVRSGSPAEKAGILEGDRIAAVNGVSLQLSPADVGDEEMAGAMTRRLSRELNKLKPGDDVELRLVSGSQHKTIKVRTVAREDLDADLVNRRDADRATLGLNLAVTGTSRDTIGVFVMGVVDGGPAAKAGIEEGSRIASINGVDLRGTLSGNNDDEDFASRSAAVNRLEREVSRAKPGDDVTLRVYYDKQFRTVTVKAGRLSDLPRRARSLTVLGGDNVLSLRALGSPFPGPALESIQSLPRILSEALPGFRNRLSW